jgi:hypothetical protein
VLVLVGVNPAQCVSHVKTQRGENTTSGLWVVLVGVGVGGVLVLVGVNPAQCVSHVKTYSVRVNPAQCVCVSANGYEGGLPAWDGSKSGFCRRRFGD